MMGADAGFADSVFENGSSLMGVSAYRSRGGLSAVDLEREFGSAIDDLELGQGARRDSVQVSGDAGPAWARLFRFFQ